MRRLSKEWPISMAVVPVARFRVATSPRAWDDETQNRQSRNLTIPNGETGGPGAQLRPGGFLHRGDFTDAGANEWVCNVEIEDKREL